MSKKKKLMLEATIRPCMLSDLAGIREISDLTWGGDDYLGRIAEEWINDGNFYLAEYKGKIVGTAKMTLFPEKVVWLEGLRVHPDYLKHGFGKQLNNFLMKKALLRLEQGTSKTIEFCTYYKNIESISMAKKVGFRVVNESFVLSRSVSKRQIEPESVELPQSLLENHGAYLPYGWKSVQNSKPGRKWMKEHAHAYQVGRTIFYLGGYELCAVIPSLTEESLMEVIPALNYLFRNSKEIEILVPATQANMIPILKKHRFFFWAKPEEPNMLIFRWFAEGSGL